MSRRGANTFKQGDVTRAIKAAEKAGFEVQRVEVRNKDGSILRLDRAPRDDPNANEWDTVK